VTRFIEGDVFEALAASKVTSAIRPAGVMRHVADDPFRRIASVATACARAVVDRACLGVMEALQPTLARGPQAALRLMRTRAQQGDEFSISIEMSSPEAARGLSRGCRP